MSKPSLVIVLVEDEHHEMLIRRYLRKCQFKPNDMRIRRSPPGRGSAESWIRREFVEEVNEYRNRQTRARTALIVIIDADTHAVQDRLNQLNQALTESGKQTVGGAEQIVRLVPKLNVETWILSLNGEAVNEEDDYRRNRNDWNDLIPPAARTLRQLARSTAEPPNHCVSSLRTGVRELKRLRF
jgi:hypothetical protein